MAHHSLYLAWVGEEMFPVAVMSNEDTATETSLDRSAFMPTVMNGTTSGTNTSDVKQGNERETTEVLPSSNSPQKIDNLILAFESLNQLMTEQQKRGMSALFCNEVFFFSGFLQQVSLMIKFCLIKRYFYSLPFL
jgi:hypothetical protein